MVVRSTRKIVLSVAAAVAAFSGTATAQSVAPGPAVSVSAGASQFDLSGTGTAPTAAVRFDLPLVRNVLVEAGVGVTRPEQQFGERTTLVVPEAQLQFQLPLGRVAPYVGVGGGLAMDFWGDGVPGGTETDVTASAAGGLRWWITPRAGARAELRVRGVGEGFSGAAAEWTAGLMWRF